MADNLKLDNLEIDIVVNAEKAGSALSRLASSLKNLGRTSTGAKSAAEGVRDLGKASASSEKQVQKLAKELNKTQSELEKAKNGLKKLKDRFNETGNAVHKTTGKFQNFIKSVGRIAMYRAIRTAIKMITQAVSEGFNMFVTWDREQNNFMAGTAANVDKITEKWTILKGQIGALGGTLLNSFAPIITFVIDGLTKIIDLIQMFVRSLQGEYTYYKLIYKEASASVGQAKELKRVLFGFDELNVLPSLSGSGASAESGGWAYELVPIDSKFLNGIADLSNKIADFLGLSDDAQTSIGGLAAAVGVLIGAKALGGLVGLLPGLISGFKQKNSLLGDQATQTAADAVATKSLAVQLGAALGGATALYGYFKKNKLVVTAKVENIKSKVHLAWKSAKEWLAQKKLVIQVAVQNVLNKLYSSWKSAYNWLSQKKLVVQTTVSSILTKVSNAWKSAKQWLSERYLTVSIKYSNFKASIKKTWDSTKEWLSNRYLTVKTKVQSVTSKIASVFNAAKKWLEDKHLTISTILGASFNPMATVLTGVISALQQTANANPIVIPVVTQSTTSSTSTSTGTSSTGSFQKPFYTQLSSQLSSKLYGLNSNAQFTSTVGTMTAEEADRIVRNAIAGVGETGYTQREKNIISTIAALFFTGGLAGVGGLAGLFSSGTGVLNLLRGVLGYAKGGLVPNTGSLFIAGESGAEVVADMGSHTGVMNVSQMQEAVASGNIELINALYAVGNMINATVNNKNFDIYMDSAKVGKSVSNYQNNQMRRGIVQGVV